LDPESTVFIVAELVSALEYLHQQQNVIHRDLKPENILFSNTNHVKITDFGTAKELGENRTGSPRNLALQPLRLLFMISCFQQLARTHLLAPPSSSALSFSI
jgi:serine/threonine protein kinase